MKTKLSLQRNLAGRVDREAMLLPRRPGRLTTICAELSHTGGLPRCVSMVIYLEDLTNRTPFRTNFRVADNPGVIVWGLKSKCRIHSLLRVARHTSTRPQEWEYDVRVQLVSPFCVLSRAMGARVSPRAVGGNA
jgi:hypothetical protein